MYRKLSITRLFWRLAIFGTIFCCRLMNIFLPQGPVCSPTCVLFSPGGSYIFKDINLSFRRCTVLYRTRVIKLLNFGQIDANNFYTIYDIYSSSLQVTAVEDLQYYEEHSELEHGVKLSKHAPVYCSRLIACLVM